MCKIINVNQKNSREPRIEPCGTSCNRRKIGGLIIINYIIIEIYQKDYFQTKMTDKFKCCSSFLVVIQHTDY